MNKIITILGNRPQFIKSALISREFVKTKKIKEIIVHTGQHFDPKMSKIFFDQLDLKKPKYHLKINNLNHGAMTGRMLEKIEEIIIKENPEMVLVYGDTNSTLAGALAAAKLNIPTAHVEAGLRSYNHRMPEEINRIVVDKISNLLFCPTETAMKNLKSEGINKKEIKIVKSGDVMYDSIKFFSNVSKKQSKIIKKMKLKEFALCTIHRTDNTDDRKKLTSIFSALKKIGEKIEVVIPIHPRTKKYLEKYKIKTKNLKVIEPVGYLDIIKLIQSAKIILTDSGGLQKEAFFLQKPAVILREETEWIELVKHGFASLAGSKKSVIIENFEKMINKKIKKNNFYGKGNASQIIVNQITRYLNENNNN